MALTFAAYAVPADGCAAPFAVGRGRRPHRGQLRGVTRTADRGPGPARGDLVVLVGFVVLAGAGGPRRRRRAPRTGGAYGVLQSAGLLFFAFAGYARIATLGEEVRDPARTIPRGDRSSRSAVAVASTPASASPCCSCSARATWPTSARRSRTRVARVGAGLGGPGRPGRRGGRGARARCSRCSPASAGPRWRWPASGDLPGSWPRSTPATRCRTAPSSPSARPWSSLVLAVDLRGAIGFSSFGVLVYYAVANASRADARPAGQRRWPRPSTVLGLAGCLLLAATLPLAVGAGRAGGLRRRHGRTCRGAAPAHDHLTVPAGRPRCAPLSL